VIFGTRRLAGRDAVILLVVNRLSVAGDWAVVVISDCAPSLQVISAKSAEGIDGRLQVAEHRLATERHGVAL
jgi:hypothetical protein